MKDKMKRLALYVGWSAVLVAALAVRYVLAVGDAMKVIVDE